MTETNASEAKATEMLRDIRNKLEVLQEVIPSRAWPETVMTEAAARKAIEIQNTEIGNYVEHTIRAVDQLNGYMTWKNLSK